MEQVLPKIHDKNIIINNILSFTLHFLQRN